MKWWDTILAWFNSGPEIVVQPIPVPDPPTVFVPLLPADLLRPTHDASEKLEMDQFDHAMKFTLLWEGGYVNHPSDPGGETNFGIAKRPPPDVDIANLTEETAKDIYREKYWDKVHGDELTPRLSLAVMDYAVNSGTSRSIKALQTVVGTVADGGIGPNTLKAIKAATEEHGDKALAQEVVMSRVAFLSKLVQRKPDMAVFLHGWMKRTHQCMKEVSS